ncbi:MAG: serine/threonine-protein kinase [Pseudomonadota bacterium]
MTTDRWTELRRLFSELRDLSESTREARLAEIAQQAPDLSAELSEMFAALASPSESVTQAVGGAVQTLDEATTNHLIGKQLGAYTITEHIAHGGMGEVFAAERSDGAFDQRVAVKLIGSRVTSIEDRQRLAAERQILARLEHPGIARILDGGTADDGTTFIVMEYIDGVPIDRFCEDHSLTLDARLRLFAKVCDAVQFAHQNLIVHRDIKPSNILVSAKGEPKLLDFGIAKIINGGSDKSVDPTEFEQRAMTPDFASPEQLLGSPITTVSDIYSLGVLLYLLAAGRRPYTMHGLRASERERLLCDTDPKKPSTTAYEVLRSARETVQFPVQADRLKGDLDAMILTAMHKEPASRYRSARELYDDVHAFLDNLPVRARGRTFGYVARKFLRRHRAAALTGLVLTLSAVGALVYHTRTVSAERDRAEAEVVRAESVIQFMTDIFELQSPNQLGNTVTAKAVLDAGARTLSSRFENQPDTHARLGATIGGIYSNLGLHSEAAKHYREAIALNKANSNVHRQAESELGLANALLYLGDYEGAEQHFRSALVLANSVYEKDSMHRAHFINDLGHALNYQGRYVEARSLFEQVLSIAESAGISDDRVVAAAQANLSQIMHYQGETAAAVPLAEASLAWAEENHESNSAVVSVRKHNLASLFSELNELEEAEALYLQVYEIDLATLGADHLDRDATMTSLGVLYRRMERYDEARIWLQRAVDHAIKTRGPEQFETAYNLNNLAKLEAEVGDTKTAAQHFTEVQAIYAATIGESHPQMASTKTAFAELLLTMNQPDAAIAQATAALRICETELPAGHWLTYKARMLLGQSLLARGDSGRGASTLVEVFEGVSIDLPDHEVYAATVRALLAHYRQSGNAAQEQRFQAMLAQLD